MSKAKIYTRTGDQGMTSLIGGRRVSKASLRLNAYGTIDELNSQIGLLVCEIKGLKYQSFLENSQRILFKVGGILAFESSDESKTLVLDKSLLEDLEKEIDELEEDLPLLKSFILPGGSKGACLAHVCRSICRRAEREIVALTEEVKIDPILLSYINRMSDYFFLIARKINFLQEIEEKNI